MMEFLKRLAKVLGLPESATEQEVERAMADRLNETHVPVVAREILTALGLGDTSGQSEVIATIHAMRQRPDLTTEVASLKRRLAERDRDDLVASALKEGKITPAQKEWADSYALNDPEGFGIFVAKAPVVVPVNDLPNPAPGSGTPKRIDDDQRAINKLMGIDEATFAKYGPT